MGVMSRLWAQLPWASVCGLCVAGLNTLDYKGFGWTVSVASTNHGLTKVTIWGRAWQPLGMQQKPSGRYQNTRTSVPSSMPVRKDTAASTGKSCMQGAEGTLPVCYAGMWLGLSRVLAQGALDAQDPVPPSSTPTLCVSSGTHGCPGARRPCAGMQPSSEPAGCLAHPSVLLELTSGHS